MNLKRTEKEEWYEDRRGRTFTFASQVPRKAGHSTLKQVTNHLTVNFSIYVFSDWEGNTFAHANCACLVSWNSNSVGEMSRLRGRGTGEIDKWIIGWGAFHRHAFLSSRETQARGGSIANDRGN